MWHGTLPLCELEVTMTDQHVTWHTSTVWVRCYYDWPASDSGDVYVRSHLSCTSFSWKRGMLSQSHCKQSSVTFYAGAGEVVWTTYPPCVSSTFAPFFSLCAVATVLWISRDNCDNWFVFSASIFKVIIAYCPRHLRAHCFVVPHGTHSLIVLLQAIHHVSNRLLCWQESFYGWVIRLDPVGGVVTMVTICINDVANPCWLHSVPVFDEVVIELGWGQILQCQQTLVILFVRFCI